MHTLADKTALVTGAASGIGRELALACARRGARIVVADLDEQGASATAGFVEAQGGRARAFRVDVASVPDVDDLRRQVEAEGWQIDVLVNNAGVVHGGAFLDVAIERHVATHRVNALGAAIVTHRFLPGLLSRPDAHLVFLASAAGLVGLPFGSSYASSKWSVVGLAESLRLELKQLGHDHVHVTTVCPSFVTTGMFDGASAPRLTRPLAPSQLADLVVAAVLSNRTMVLTPWLVRLTPFLRGVLPRAAFDALARVFGVTTSMAGWRGRGSGLTP